MTDLTDTAPTTAKARAFWEDHPGGSAWCESYQATSLEVTRDWVIDAVLSLGRVRSVLELGCHCGPLLRRLAALPGVIARGIDVNSEAVLVARTHGLSAVVGTLPDALAGLASRDVDVIVSSYCLAYLSFDDVVSTLADCLRIARLGLVLVEPSAGPGVIEVVRNETHYVEWRHELLDALEAAYAVLPLPRPRVEMTRTRRDGSGNNINAVVVVRLT